MTIDEKLVDANVQRLLAEHDPKGSKVEFLGAQFDLGLAWIHFEPGCGGLGLAPPAESVNAALLEVKVHRLLPLNPIGYGMCGPTVYTHGSEEQKARYLRPLFTAEEIWCQLFSEPSAGSDVAGLTSKAVATVRRGGEWAEGLDNSRSRIATWGCLVTRTDPDAPKHKGLSYFVVDMHQPGVDVRPLRQMTGDAEFNEVYFTDARVSDSERLGKAGDGWRVALTTLMNERVAIGGAQAPRGSGPIGESLRLWSELGSHQKSVALQDRLMSLWSKAEVARLTNIRASQNRATGVPGPEGSTGKLAFAENNKEIHEFNMELLGASAMLYGSYDIERSAKAMGAGSTQQQFLRSRANSIEGGTSEVMRNILGERVPGLPGDVRTDKELPFTEVPNN